jgi:hypothetical protein
LFRFNPVDLNPMTFGVVAQIEQVLQAVQRVLASWAPCRGKAEMSFRSMILRRIKREREGASRDLLYGHLCKIMFKNLLESLGKREGAGARLAPVAQTWARAKCLCETFCLGHHLWQRFHGNCGEKNAGQARLIQASKKRTPAKVTEHCDALQLQHLLHDVADGPQKRGVVKHKEGKPNVEAEEDAQLGQHWYHDGGARLHRGHCSDALPSVVVYVGVDESEFRSSLGENDAICDSWRAWYAPDEVRDLKVTKLNN